MRYRVVAVGRVKDAALRAACDEYLARLRHYAKVEELEVKDEARVLGAIPDGSRLVALSRRGEGWSSTALAEQTARWELEARDVTFAIGGADTLPADVLGGGRAGARRARVESFAAHAAARAGAGDRVRAAVSSAHHPARRAVPSRDLS